MSYVLAIDFGTSTTAAAVGFDGSAHPVLLDGGLAQMLSGVLLQESTGRLLFGEAADNEAIRAPFCLERTPKRRLGQDAMLLGGQRVPVVDAVATVLSHALAEAVRQRAGERPALVRLTHPVRWGRERCAALLRAAQLAELGEPELMAEPVAAARHYAADLLRPGERVAVYDLGGGTFDTAVLERTAEGFVVAGQPGGDDALGGEGFDHRLYVMLGERLQAAQWSALRASNEEGGSLEWARANREFQRWVRRAKELLSNSEEAVVYIPAPVDRDLTVTRTQFEALIRADIELTVEELQRTIRASGSQPAQLRAVYLAGGASQIPLVSELLRERLGVPVALRGNPKAVISLGAALQGRLAEGPKPEPKPEPKPKPDPDPVPPPPPRRLTAAAALLALIAAIAVGAYLLARPTAPTVNGPFAARAAGSWSFQRTASQFGQLGINLRLNGPAAKLGLELVSVPMPTGNSQLVASSVSLGTPAQPLRYQGYVYGGSLKGALVYGADGPGPGSTLLAQVSGPHGRRLNLKIALTTGSGHVLTGSVSALPTTTKAPDPAETNVIAPTLSTPVYDVDAAGALAPSAPLALASERTVGYLFKFVSEGYQNTNIELNQAATLQSRFSFAPSASGAANVESSLASAGATWGVLAGDVLQTASDGSDVYLTLALSGGSISGQIVYAELQLSGTGPGSIRAITLSGLRFIPLLLVGASGS